MYYSASIFLEGVHITRPEIQSLWEEVVIFVEAVDEKEAKEKAELFGKKTEIE